jgi:hypothetical protein
MSLLNPTPEQQARRQHLYAILLLIGIPILNALLQKYGIPPIVVPTQQIQQPTLAPAKSECLDLIPTATTYCSLREPTFPLVLGHDKPIRNAIKEARHQRKGFFRRIHERRHPSASAASPSHLPLPAEEAPAVLPKGCNPWSACLLQ